MNVQGRKHTVIGVSTRNISYNYRDHLGPIPLAWGDIMFQTLLANTMNTKECSFIIVLEILQYIEVFLPHFFIS
jgi:hypothetical protein